MTPKQEAMSALEGCVAELAKVSAELRDARKALTDAESRHAFWYGASLCAAFAAVAAIAAVAAGEGRKAAADRTADAAEKIAAWCDRRELNAVRDYFLCAGVADLDCTDAAKAIDAALDKRDVAEHEEGGE